MDADQSILDSGLNATSRILYTEKLALLITWYRLLTDVLKLFL